MRPVRQEQKVHRDYPVTKGQLGLQALLVQLVLRASPASQAVQGQRVRKDQQDLRGQQDLLDLQVQRDRQERLGLQAQRVLRDRVVQPDHRDQQDQLVPQAQQVGRLRTPLLMALSTAVRTPRGFQLEVGEAVELTYLPEMLAGSM